MLALDGDEVEQTQDPVDVGGAKEKYVLKKGRLWSFKESEVESCEKDSSW